jgi:hypothetical protein
MAAKPCECSKKYIGAYLNGEFYGMWTQFSKSSLKINRTEYSSETNPLLYGQCFKKKNGARTTTFPYAKTKQAALNAEKLKQIF